MFVRSAIFKFSSLPSPLVSVEYLKQNLNKIKVLDCSLYMPHMNRDAEQEYKKSHIPGAIRYDLAANSLQDSSLLFMSPKQADFERAVGNMGISNDDQVVVYDGMNIFSSARVYWQFKYFGHKQISVLDGGFPAWVTENYPVSDAPPQIKETTYRATPQSHMLRDINYILKNIENQKNGQKGVQVLDARRKEAFYGETLEPLPMPIGHMPYSKSLPLNQLIDQRTGLMKSVHELYIILNNLNVDLQKEIVCSCYVGVTAAVIYVALERMGLKHISLYDGSWQEYASTKGVEIRNKQ